MSDYINQTYLKHRPFETQTKNKKNKRIKIDDPPLTTFRGMFEAQRKPLIAGLNTSSSVHFSPEADLHTVNEIHNPI